MIKLLRTTTLFQITERLVQIIKTLVRDILFHHRNRIHITQYDGTNPTSLKRTFLGGIVITLTFVLANTALAQQPVVSDYKKVPIPPSPNASALGKFGDIPVSPSTGIPDVSIPIYSYSDSQKDMNLDISLRYHAGGHKVEDMASNVGLGWALNAGGVIMRTVKGLPDDMPYGYLRTPCLPLLNTVDFDINLTDPIMVPQTNQGICIQNSPSFLTVKQIAEQLYDGESDIFNLSVGGINEKFFFDKNGKPVFMTPNNLQLRYTNGIGNHSIKEFNLTDSKGVRYFFDVLEYTQSDNAVEPSVPSPPMYISSWYLSKIRSADKTDSIQFLYSDTTVLSYEAGLTLSYRTQEIGNISSTETQSYNITHIYQPKRISKILLPDKTTVDFYYTREREDYAGDKALTSIEVSGNHYEKLFLLHQDYFVSDDCYQEGGQPCPYPPGSPNNWQKRLKLLWVKQKSAPDSIPPYLFEYNNTPLPFRNSKNQDWWGFYNGGNRGELISNARPISILGYDLIPSLLHCKAGILERIVYPTGGESRFTYELNEGISEGVVKPIGGLRVQKKEDFDPVTNATHTTTYTYAKPDNTTSGLLITIPSYTAYQNTMLIKDWNNINLWRDIYFNESLNPTQTLSYFNGSPVIYTRVKEEQYVSGIRNGYRIYEFSAGSNDQMHDNTYPFVQKQDITWKRGLLLKTGIYNNTDSLLTSEENEYQIIDQEPQTTDSTTRNLVVGNYRWDNLETITERVYGARYYYLKRGKSQLVKTTRKEYSVTRNMMQAVTEYMYDETYHVPVLTKTTDSEGRVTEIKSYYPFHYDSATFPLLGQLRTANRVAETVSTEEWRMENGQAFVKSFVVNDYAIVNANQLKKNKTSVLEATNLIPFTEIGAFNPISMDRGAPIKEKVRIEKFDPRGRGVEFKYNDGTEMQSLIWGDHNEFPIASVTNAAYEDVAFTSFETAEKGNWEFIHAPVPDATAPTGKSVLSVVPYISKTINPTKVYTVSLWRKGSISVSNATLVHVGQTVNGWTYEEYQVMNASEVAITGSGYVDELRLYPKNSEMKSYTYLTPSTITSVSDANGVLSHYEYDRLGRLKTIKDSDGNVLKTFVYHYHLE